MKAFRKASVLAACIVFLCAGFARASYLDLGNESTYPIYVSVNGVQQTAARAGSYTASLDGVALEFLYCVDFFKTVKLDTDYKSTVVNRDGVLYGEPVRNADQVAWLLDNYGVGGNGNDAAALQAAIWNVVSTPEKVVTLDSRAGAAQLGYYETYLDGLAAALNVGETGNVSDYYWITPGTENKYGGLIEYQGLVGASPVPVPAAAWLLGAGLFGLVGIRRKARN